MSFENDRPDDLTTSNKVFQRDEATLSVSGRT
jgi:hypothetical protein